MAFLSIKIVPTTTGCIGSGTPVKQLLFPSLETIMRMGWKTSGVQVSIDGAISVPASGGYTRTFDDTGTSPSYLAQAQMSDYVCNARPAAYFGATFNFNYTSTDPADPSGFEPASVYLNMMFGQALKNESAYWFLGSSAGLDVVGSAEGGASAGSVFIDGNFVSNVFINLAETVTIIRPYTITFTTIQENLAQ